MSLINIKQIYSIYEWHAEIYPRGYTVKLVMRDRPLMKDYCSSNMAQHFYTFVPPMKTTCHIRPLSVRWSLIAGFTRYKPRAMPEVYIYILMPLIYALYLFCNSFHYGKLYLGWLLTCLLFITWVFYVCSGILAWDLHILTRDLMYIKV